MATRLATSSPIVKFRLTGEQHVIDTQKKIKTTRMVKVAVRTMRYVDTSLRKADNSTVRQLPRCSQAL